MLQQLIVQHFALVNFLHLEFGNNMTAISGETGAGKSILLDALGLALGNRAESGCVRPGSEKADIHAVFDLHHQPAIKDFLLSKQLASSADPETCILRRIINQDGRSRGYINGKPVNITSLKQVGKQLINIHGQHEHQHLLAKDSHLRLLDEFGNFQPLLQEVHRYSQAWLELDQQAKALSGDQRLNEAEQQLLTYQVEELKDLALQAGELEQLEQEHQQLAQADQLLQAVQSVLPEHNDNDPKDNIVYWQQQLEPFADHSPRLASVIEMLASAAIQIEESQSELNSFLQGFNQDPSQLANIEARLDAIYSVARKHKVQPARLLEHSETLAQHLQNNLSKETQLQAIAEQKNVIAEHYKEQALCLTKVRKQTAKKLQKAVIEQFKQLGMPDCSIEFSIQPRTTEGLSGKGLDDIEMLVQTNPGQAPKALAKIASGGELSRISLAIQVVIAKTSITPSLIFDEVDVGIGGATAEIVGRLLAQLGQHCQLLCITHLPQVASQAQHHLRVSKQTQDQLTQTHVLPLTRDQRVSEIARMLGGITLTEQTLAHAQEMLGGNAMH